MFISIFLLYLTSVFVSVEINCLERSRVRGQDRSRYLFQTGRDTPATGLHGTVLAAHVLAHLPVLLSTLLSASTERRIAEERRNTVTGQSTGRREREREQSAKERESQPAEAKRNARHAAWGEDVRFHLHLCVWQMLFNANGGWG